MPKYNYRCLNCEEVLEVEHSMDASPTVMCKSCGGPDTYKIITKTPRHMLRGDWSDIGKDPMDYHD